MGLPITTTTQGSEMLTWRKQIGSAGISGACSGMSTVSVDPISENTVLVGHGALDGLPHGYWHSDVTIGRVDGDEVVACNVAVQAPGESQVYDYFMLLPAVQTLNEAVAWVAAQNFTFAWVVVNFTDANTSDCTGQLLPY